MKSLVFTTKDGITFEFENVIYVKQSEHQTQVYLFAGYCLEIFDAKDLASFKMWYKIYLENKYETVEEEDMKPINSPDREEEELNPEDIL